jgi:hypothetical protein
MSGCDELYVIGGNGGFMGADGANPIEVMILVGNGSRMWFTPHFFVPEIKPLGNMKY